MAPALSHPAPASNHIFYDTPIANMLKPQSTVPTIQPALLVCITFFAFLVLVFISLLFSFWQWRRAYRCAQEEIRQPLLASRELLKDRSYLKEQRESQPILKFKLNTECSQLSIPKKLSSELEASTPASTTVNPPQSARWYDMAAQEDDEACLDSPPPYTKVPSMPASLVNSPTTPYSPAGPPPRVPAKSCRRRKPVNLRVQVISPPVSERRSHQLPRQNFQKLPSPYPLQSQLTPDSALADVSNPPTPDVFSPYASNYRTIVWKRALAKLNASQTSPPMNKKTSSTTKLQTLPSLIIPKTEARLPVAFASPSSTLVTPGSGRHSRRLTPVSALGGQVVLCSPRITAIKRQARIRVPLSA